MKIRNKILRTSNILVGCIFIVLFGVFFQSKTSSVAEARSNADQVKNFNDDLNKANNYWIHNNLGWDYAKGGQYDKAVEEYQKAIQIIENAHDEYLRTDVSKEYRDGVNHELKVNSQIFSRYGLIDALEKAGKYEEAVQNVDWLMQNQKVKGKEELLKKKLDGMKQRLLQKMHQSK